VCVRGRCCVHVFAQYTTANLPNSNGTVLWSTTITTAHNATYPDQVYIVGTSGSGFASSAVLARANLDDLLRFDWGSLECVRASLRGLLCGDPHSTAYVRARVRYWGQDASGGKAWVREFNPATLNEMFAPGVPESTLYFDEAQGLWLMPVIYFGDTKIVMWTAEAATGPWTGPTALCVGPHAVVCVCLCVCLCVRVRAGMRAYLFSNVAPARSYDIPAPWNDTSTFFSYAPKFHPQMLPAAAGASSSTSAMIMSYVTNGPWDVMFEPGRADTYVPRLLRLNITA
jgi:hypothetical protein